MMLIDFFKSVCEGKVSEDNIHSEVKKITKNFDPDKVYELHNKFNDFLDQYDFLYKTKLINNISLLDDSIAKNIESFNDFIFSVMSDYPDKYRVTSETELLLNREIFQEFEKINYGELSELEQIYFIEKATDWKENKLHALLNDLREFIFIKKKLLDDSITDEQIKNVIKHYKKTNSETPLILEIYDSELGKWRERVGDEMLDINSKDFSIEDYLDLEAIFYPHKFHHIRGL